MTVFEKECEYLKLDKSEVQTIMKGLVKYSKMANKLGLQLFCGTGLQLRQAYTYRKSIVVAYDGTIKCDGGDGSYKEDEEGLLRGE